MADNKFVTLEALKSTTVRLQQEWLKSISKAGHARFEVAEAIPDASAAQENIMYLVMNDKTQPVHFRRQRDLRLLRPEHGREAQEGRCLCRDHHRGRFHL